MAPRPRPSRARPARGEDCGRARGSSVGAAVCEHVASRRGRSRGGSSMRRTLLFGTVGICSIFTCEHRPRHPMTAFSFFAFLPDRPVPRAQQVQIGAGRSVLAVAIWVGADGSRRASHARAATQARSYLHGVSVRGAAIGRGGRRCAGGDVLPLGVARGRTWTCPVCRKLSAAVDLRRSEARAQDDLGRRGFRAAHVEQPPRRAMRFPPETRAWAASVIAKSESQIPGPATPRYSILILAAPPPRLSFFGTGLRFAYFELGTSRCVICPLELPRRSSL